MRTVLDVWNRLSLNQRLTIGTIGGALGVSLMIFLLWARQPDYTLLYANVDPEDAAEIIDELRSRKVPFKLEGGGRTILVPSKHVYESRLELAVNGLPESGIVGYEIFDKTGFGVTDFVQRVNHRRALEGEIARTIQQLDEVRAARVHIVMPDEALFAEEQKPATASVVLRLKGSLGQGRISGIVRLVAASVEGLLPENVTVVDTIGNLLSSAKEENSFAAVSGAQLELKAQVESYIRGKIIGLLEGVLGHGRLVAQVDAQLDFERIERTSETFDGENPAIRSEQRSKGTEEASKNENVTTNYEISKTLEHIVSPVGGIERLTVAVLVDGTYEVGDDGAKTYVPRGDQEMERLTGIIRTAVGFDDDRGDRLEVHNVAFDTETLSAEVDAIDRSGRMTLLVDVLHRVGQVLVVLLLAVLARHFYHRTAVAVREHRESVLARSGEGVAAMAAPSEDEHYLRIQQDITEIVEQRPEEIGQLIRTWLKED